MRVFKHLRAYYTGMLKCNNLDRKVLPPHVYDYSETEMKWFIKGLLTRTDKKGNVIYYRHPSVVYLVNIDKLLKDNGINTKLVCDNVARHIEITK